MAADPQAPEADSHHVAPLSKGMGLVLHYSCTSIAGALVKTHPGPDIPVSGGEFLPLLWEQRSLTSCFLLRSRLGCQVCVKKSMDGLTVRVPMDVSDMRKQLEVGKQSKQ